jgi:hypothetical protein
LINASQHTLQPRLVRFNALEVEDVPVPVRYTDLFR